MGSIYAHSYSQAILVRVHTAHRVMYFLNSSLRKGVGLEDILTMCHFICYQDSTTRIGTLDTTSKEIVAVHGVMMMIVVILTDTTAQSCPHTKE